MTVKITEIGITIPGKVVRKYDEGANETTLTVNAVQARELDASLDLARQFLDGGEV